MNIELTLSKVVAERELWTATFRDERGYFAAGVGHSAAQAIQRARASLVWMLCKPVPFGARR